MKISVNKWDIRLGQRRASDCPIALAIKRALPGVDNVNVIGERIIYTFDRIVYVHMCDKLTKHWIWSYDDCDIVTSFDFELMGKEM